jgi:lysophospholipase L1-like esterase
MNRSVGARAARPRETELISPIRGRAALCLLLVSLFRCEFAVAAPPTPPFELREGDRVVFLGDTFIEREQYYGWIELMLTTRFPDRNVTFRNLGWSADTPAGDSRFGLSLLQAGKEPPDEGWKQLVRQLEDARPTVVFVGYGMASSFDGEPGLPRFKADYNRLLDTLEKISPGVSLVLLSPFQHEDLKSPWPDPEGHNTAVESYSEAIGEIAESRSAVFIPIHTIAVGPSASPAGQTSQARPTFTANGIHLNSEGYRLVASAMDVLLFQGLGQWMKTDTGNLRDAILRKNEWFFHRSRPANMAYIFGFRKREQGQNAVEIPKFDELIAAEEKRIAALRSLKTGVSVPEVKTHVGNISARSRRSRIRTSSWARASRSRFGPRTRCSTSRSR